MTEKLFTGTLNHNQNKYHKKADILHMHICEHKDDDQLCCDCYTESTIPILSKTHLSSVRPSSVTAQLSLYPTWSETPKTGFLA